MSQVFKMCSLCLARHGIFIIHRRSIQGKTLLNQHCAALPFIHPLPYPDTFNFVFSLPTSCLAFRTNWFESVG